MNEIKKVFPSRDPRSSPALSLDRLKIEYANNKLVLISPLEKKEFIELLRSNNIQVA